MENNRNFFITIALSVLILTLWQVFYMNPRIEAQREAARVEAERVEAESKAAVPAPQQTPGVARPASPGAAGTVPGSAGVPGTDGASQASRDAALATTQRVPIDTPRLSGSINLVGARLDDIRLKDYRLTVEKNSPTIELLNPAVLPNGQFVEIGFDGSATTGAVPGADTVWTVEGTPTLTPDTPVTLTFTNDKGLTFRRTIAVDDNYMFTVADTVDQRRHPARDPLQLRSRHPLRQADACQRLRASRGADRRHRRGGPRGGQLLRDREGEGGQAGQVEQWLARHHRQVLGRRPGAVRDAAVPAALRLFCRRAATLSVRLHQRSDHRRARRQRRGGDQGVRRGQGGGHHPGLPDGPEDPPSSIC